MLSISFSRIVDNVRRGTYTATDYREIKLWARICLNHLQYVELRINYFFCLVCPHTWLTELHRWAATTGRPSSITAAYLYHSYILINMDQATIRDGQIVADIHLYSTLHRALSSRPRSNDEPPEEEFSAWKQKWGHLFCMLSTRLYEVLFLLITGCSSAKRTDARNKLLRCTPHSCCSLYS